LIEKPYDKLALIYNGVMEHVDYEQWARYIKIIAENYIDRNAQILELAAGNCNLANLLIKEFPNIIVSDISLPMLKSSTSTLFPKFVCDMKLLPFKNQFSFIYSTFDSINYLLSKKAILQLFNQIKIALKQDGIFTFDVSMENNSLGDKEFSDGGNISCYTFTRKSKYYKGKKLHQNIFYISDGNGLSVKEVHYQKIYEFDTYFYLAEKAGLAVLKCYDGFTFESGNRDSSRLQFIIKK
jgi:SAM-dependent methyltransferase